MTPIANSLALRVAANITRLRAARGMSQVDLAKHLKTTQGYVSLVEGGKRVPSLELIERIAKVFAVDPSKLFEGSK